MIIELQEKYAQVLKLGKELNVRDGMTMSRKWMER